MGASADTGHAVRTSRRGETTTSEVAAAATGLSTSRSFRRQAYVFSCLF